MKDLLNPNCFWNIVLIAGFALIVISVLRGPVAIDVGGKKLTANVGLGKRTLLVIGVIMIAVSIVFMTLTNWGGLISPVHGKAAAEVPEHTNGMLHLGQATTGLAQIGVSASQPEPIATLNLIARHASRAPKPFDSDITVYVGAITLLGRTRVLIYHSDSVPNGENHYHLLRPTLKKEQIIFDEDVKSGQTKDFSWEGRKYTASIELKWFLRGENYAALKAFPR